jgi:uncharacterized membrane protein YkvA (DUF1232 family)
MRAPADIARAPRAGWIGRTANRVRIRRTAIPQAGTAIGRRLSSCPRRRDRVDRTETAMWKRLMFLWTLLRTDAGRVWAALRHPLTPGWFKLAVGLAALYLVSPVDLVPDVLPLLGLADDLVLVPLALRWLLARLPAEVRGDLRGR